MPSQLFYTTQIPVFQFGLFLKTKNKKAKPYLLMQGNLGTMVTRKLRQLTDKDIQPNSPNLPSHSKKEP